MSKKNSNAVFYLIVFLILCFGVFSIFTYLDNKAGEEGQRKAQELFDRQFEKTLHSTIRNR